MNWMNSILFISVELYTRTSSGKKLSKLKILARNRLYPLIALGSFFPRKSPYPSVPSTIVHALPISTVQIKQTLALVPFAVLAGRDHLADHDGMISYLHAFLPHPAAVHPPYAALASLQPRRPIFSGEGAGFDHMRFLGTRGEEEVLRQLSVVDP